MTVTAVWTIPQSSPSSQRRLTQFRPRSWCRVTKVLRMDKLLRDSSEGARLISHPAHIEDSRPSPSAFIPFCSLGGDLAVLGRKSPRFSVPVCAVFTEKIVGGQLCYEAQLGRYSRGAGWEETLQRGLSLVIDTNEEYDVKHLFTRLRTNNRKDPNTFLAYEETKERSSFSILLGTISTLFHDNITQAELTRSG